MLFVGKSCIALELYTSGSGSVVKKWYIGVKTWGGILETVDKEH